jgi:hypothetical protein
VSDPVSLREFIEMVIAERDRGYMERFRSIDASLDRRFKDNEIAFSAALTAQEKATSAAFLASEKAIVKAEDAQRDYNARSNEFRGQLDDQAKTFLTRFEADSKFEAIAVNIQDLRESRSTESGRALAGRDSRTQGNWGISLVVAILLSLLSLAVTLFRLYK